MRTIEQGMNKLNSFPSPRVTSYSVRRLRLRLKFTPNGKRQIQVENFSE